MSSTVSPGPDTAADQPVRVRMNGWTIGFLASAALLLIGSIVPLWPGGQNLWSLSPLFLLGVGVVAPLIAAALEVARAASPDPAGPGPRVGSLSTSQFSHVVSWLAFAHFFLLAVTTLAPMALIGLVGSLGMVVCSPLRFLLGGRGDAPVRGGADDRAFGAGLLEDEPVGGPVGGPESPEDIQASWQSAQSGWQPAGETGWYTASGPRQGSWNEPDDARQPGLDGSEGPGEAEVSAERPSAADGWGAGEERGSGELTGAGEEARVGGPMGAGEQPSVRELDPDEQVISHEETVLRSDLRGATAAESGAETGADTGAEPSAHRVSAEEAEQGTTPRGAEPAQYEAFWFAVGSPRQAVGADGHPVFDLEPGGWILALEDRGEEYLVQNTDGRTGLLRDLRDIERA